MQAAVQTMIAVTASSFNVHLLPHGVIDSSNIFILWFIHSKRLDQSVQLSTPTAFRK